MTLRYEQHHEHPDERKRFIRGLFDSIVPTYDLLNHLLSMGIDAGWRRATIARLGDLRGKIALDLCCGTGDLSRLLSRAGAAVVSLDFSLPMLSTGVATGKLAGHPVAADASVLPLGDGTIDAATIAFGIRNIPDIPRMLADLHRVLRPEGRFAILELTRPGNRIIGMSYRFYLARILPFIGGFVSGRRTAYRYLAGTIETFLDPDELARALETAGFSNIHIARKTFGIATIITCRK